MKLLYRLSVLIICFSLYACSNEEEKEEIQSSSSNEELKEVSKGVDLIYSDSAKVKAHLTTPVYIQYKSKPLRDEMPEGLYVEFFSSDSIKVETTLSSKKGIRWPEKKLMEVSDSVVIVNLKKGERLTTELLIWDEYKQKIYTDEFVKITTEDKIIEGYGLEADEKLERYEIKQMSGVIYLDAPLQ